MHELILLVCCGLVCKVLSCSGCGASTYAVELGVGKSSRPLRETRPIMVVKDRLSVNKASTAADEDNEDNTSSIADKDNAKQKALLTYHAALNGTLWSWIAGHC